MSIFEKDLNIKIIDDAIINCKEGVEIYLNLMNQFKSINVSTCTDFQKKYKYLYKIRRNQNFCEIFFDYLENCKTRIPAFEIILKKFKILFGRFEASYSSKLLATLNPDYPILDKFVMKNLGLNYPGYYTPDREKKIVDIYYEIKTKIEALIQSKQGADWIELFNKKLDYPCISDTKKIDFILWKIRCKK